MLIETVSDIIRVHGVDRAERTALIMGDRALTWAELLGRSGQVAQALAAEGVGNQDNVAFLDKNGIEHFEVFYGAAMLNAICVDVNWRLAAPEVEYIVNDAEAKVFVVGQDFLPILDAIAPNLTTVKKIVVIADAKQPGAPTDAAFETYEDWLGRQPAVDPGVQSTSEDVAF